MCLMVGVTLVERVLFSNLYDDHNEFNFMHFSISSYYFIPSSLAAARRLRSGRSALLRAAEAELTWLCCQTPAAHTGLRLYLLLTQQHDARSTLRAPPHEVQQLMYSQSAFWLRPK